MIEAKYLISIAEAAKLAGVGKSAIENRIARGKLEAVKVNGVNFVDKRNFVETATILPIGGVEILISTKEVGLRLGIKPSRVRSLVHTGHLKFSAVEGDKYLFSITNINDYLRMSDSEKNKIERDFSVKQTRMFAERTHSLADKLVAEYNRNPEIKTLWLEKMTSDKTFALEKDAIYFACRQLHLSDICSLRHKAA